MLRKALWGPTLFVAVAVVARSLSLGQRAAQEAIVPTLLFSGILWFFLIARESRPGLLRGVLVGALIGVVTQGLPVLLDVIWGGVETYLPVSFQASLGIWSTLLGGLTGLLAVTIQRRLEEGEPGEGA